MCYKIEISDKNHRDIYYNNLNSYCIIHHSYSTQISNCWMILLVHIIIFNMDAIKSFIFSNKFTRRFNIFLPFMFQSISYKLMNWKWFSRGRINSTWCGLPIMKRNCWRLKIKFYSLTLYEVNRLWS